MRAAKKISSYLLNIVSLSAKRVEEHGAQYELFGIFAVVNYIVPYFMWSPSSSNNYTLLICLRLIAGTLCFLLIIKDHWLDSLKNFLPLYWHLTLLYCLPFLTTFMLFDSKGDIFWLMNMVLMLLLLAVLVDWRSFIVILIPGVVFGYGLFVFTGESKFFSLSFETSYWAIYMCFFSVLIGIMFSRRNEKIAAEKIGAYKSVSASIAHEMRTPLSSMFIGAQGVQKYLPSLLKAYEIAENEKLNIPKIDKQKLQLLKDFPNQFISISRRSLSIIDIFLTKFGSLEKNALDLETFSISKCIKCAIEEFPFYPKEQINLISFQPEKDFFVLGDESLVIHVFTNLLKNSLYQIKVAKKGNIKIRLSKSNRFNIVHFCDDATGIKSSDLGKIFDKFYTGNRYGTGIGLAYCKNVMEVFGGQIACRSSHGEYTEFQLFFPKVKS